MPNVVKSVSLKLSVGLIFIRGSLDFNMFLIIIIYSNSNLQHMKRKENPLVHNQFSLRDFCYKQKSKVRPGADQPSKAAFGKSAFAKSKLSFGKALLLEADLILDRASLLHRKQWSGQVQRAKCFLLKRARKHFCFLLDWCAPCRLFNKRKHVLAKALLPKAALLDWSAPSLRSRTIPSLPLRFISYNITCPVHLFSILLLSL